MQLSAMEHILREGACLVGMGNPYRSDDAVGVVIAERIAANAPDDSVKVINAEDVLESYLFSIAASHQKHVLLVDAVQTGSEAGAVIFGKTCELDELIMNISTHKLSLQLCDNVLKEYGKQTWLLGIEAETIDFGYELTEHVARTADIITDYILNILQSSPKGVYR